MVGAALIVFVLHEEQVSVEAVERVPEEERYEAVGPRVRAKDVQHPELGTRESDPGQKLELKVGLGIQLALDVVLENELRQFRELTLERMQKPFFTSVRRWDERSRDCQGCCCCCCDIFLTF